MSSKATLVWMYTDDQGICHKIYVMFHGTSQSNANSIMSQGGRFKPSSRGMLGPGVYVSRDVEKAKNYGPVIFYLLVYAGKVCTINSQDHPLKDVWQQFGYDSAWVPPNCGMVPSGKEENCIKSPGQIVIVGVPDGIHFGRPNDAVYSSGNSWGCNCKKAATDLCPHNYPILAQFVYQRLYRVYIQESRNFGTAEKWIVNQSQHVCEAGGQRSNSTEAMPTSFCSGLWYTTKGCGGCIGMFMSWLWMQPCRWVKVLLFVGGMFLIGGFIYALIRN